MSDTADIRGVEAISRVLSSLEKDLTGDTMLKALQKGGQVLQEQTRRILVSKLGEGATSTKTRKTPMTKGVTNKADRAYGEVRVSILGDFRLKWFELGTKQRKLLRGGAKDRGRGYTKGDRRYLYRKKGKENLYRRGGNRGRIKALGFFSDARADAGPVMEAITAELEKRLKQQ